MIYSKESHGSSLVNKFGTCSFEETYSNLTFCSRTFSLRKCILIGMFLVLECMKGFLEILMALALSWTIGKGWGKEAWKDKNVWIIYISWVQQEETTTYSISTIDKAIELWWNQ